jgi:hypothetical protein
LRNQGSKEAGQEASQGSGRPKKMLMPIAGEKQPKTAAKKSASKPQSKSA